MTVLVAIPCGPGIPGELLDKAVRHALAQKGADVVVLVAGDGQAPSVTVRDSRLVTGKFATNRGAPFTQQAMLLGSPFEWYAPHGADDWIEPNHIASLLALRAAVNGSGRIWYHGPKRVEILSSPRTWIEFGVMDTAALKAIGGYNPAEPFGQDSVLISVVLKTLRVRLTNRPTYHKQWRAESLTHHPETRGGSTARTAVRDRNRAVLLECQRLGWRPAAVRAYRESLVPAETRRALDKSAALVAKWLA